MSIYVYASTEQAGESVAKPSLLANMINTQSPFISLYVGWYIFKLTESRTH